MKKNKLSFLFLLFLTSCFTEYCGDLNYDNGLTYKQGVLFTGTCKSYDLSNQLRSVQSYNNGLDHGEWVFYSKNGSILTEGVFVNGKRDGVWKYYYETGEIWKINVFEMDKKIGEWITYNIGGEIIDQVKY